MAIAARWGGVFLALLLVTLTSNAEGPIIVPVDSGVVTGPFVITNGYLLQALNTATGRAVYRFTNTSSGGFVLQALVNAPGGPTNFLLVNIDAEPESPTMAWAVPQTTGFTNQLVSWRADAAASTPYFRRKVFNLARGEHQIIIRGSLGAVQLARITVLSLPPTPTGLRVVTSPDRDSSGRN